MESRLTTGRLRHLVLGGSLILCSCAARPALENVDFRTLEQCPSQERASPEPQDDTPMRRDGISVNVLPLKLPVELQEPQTDSPRFARRVAITFAPGIVRADQSLLWARLSLRTFGGTIAGWTRVNAYGASLELATPGRSKDRNDEFAAVEAGSGYITVERMPRMAQRAASALSLDLLIAPGGVPIDEPAIRIRQLWTPEGKALSADALQIELVPTRHPPGADVVEADVQLEYVVAPQRSDAIPCKSSAHGRAILVERDLVRPALWDLGVSSLNGPRIRWLALSSPTAGVVRAIFESPEAATSFANWIRAQGATQIGDYRLGVFQQSGRRPLRPYVPVDFSASGTFQPLTPNDAVGLRVGPLGEP